MTDNEIRTMDDNLFIQTQAFFTFRTKEIFIQKIRDITIRRKMLRLN